MQTAFLEYTIEHLETSLSRVKICLDQVTEKEVWQKPNDNTNSIANLILHLCGNITQYIHAALGKAADLRQRDREFSTEGGYDKTQLLKKITTVTNKAVLVVQNTNAETLVHIHQVQGFQLSGIAIIIHVLEHYSYHVGQIALYTKLIKNQDLGFYADQDLNIKND